MTPREIIEDLTEDNEQMQQEIDRNREIIRLLAEPQAGKPLGGTQEKEDAGLDKMLHEIFAPTPPPTQREKEAFIASWSAAGGSGAWADTCFDAAEKAFQERVPAPATEEQMTAAFKGEPKEKPAKMIVCALVEMVNLGEGITRGGLGIHHYAKPEAVQERIRKQAVNGRRMPSVEEITAVLVGMLPRDWHSSLLPVSKGYPINFDMLGVVAEREGYRLDRPDKEPQKEPDPPTKPIVQAIVEMFQTKEGLARGTWTRRWYAKPELVREHMILALRGIGDKPVPTLRQVQHVLQDLMPEHFSPKAYLGYPIDPDRLKGMAAAHGIEFGPPKNG